jgi:hypothetical protein
VVARHDASKDQLFSEVTMKKTMTGLLCKVLIVVLAWTPFQMVQAGMIGTAEQIAVSTANSERSAVLSLINRADVARELQAYGVDLSSAKERIAALTDAEVRSLAGTLNTAPAGAADGFAILVLVGVILWLVFWRR